MFDESATESWHLRYGTEPPEEMPDLGRFLTHRSVRRYAEKPISESVMQAIVAAGQSAATSSNLQLWSIVSIEDKERRNLIADLCDDQDQIRQAARFFAFFADHSRLRKAAKEAGEKAEGLDYQEYYVMAIIDAALAAERMVCASESIGIATCYIGALRNDVQAVTDLLEAPLGTVPLFGLCFGWPHDEVTAEIKPRLSQNCVWHQESFPAEPSIGDYNERMASFYETQGMSTAASWAMRSGRRVDNNHLFGRERLGHFVQQQGLNLR